jgi:hypothetical protein
MTEPERDDSTIDAVLKELHRSAVPKHVRRNALLLKRRALCRRRLCVLPHDLLDSVAAQLLVAVADEDRVGFRSATLGQPVAQHLDAVPADRRRPLLASLSHAPDVRAWTKHDVAAAQTDQL